MKKLMAFMLVLVCVFSLVACNGKPIVVSIRQEGRSSLCAIEPFYEDENYIYSFPYYGDSNFITVTYLDGSTENIIPALESGRVSIKDLDRFGIKYYAEEKQKYWPLLDP